jgi:transcriptional repressor NrdR
MRCPKCAHMDDKVIDSRSVREGIAIRRRRCCLRCGYRFTTYEEVVKTSLRVVKQDGRHKDMDRNKLLSGIERACEKRPISMQQIESLVDALITELESEFEREVPSQEIGKRVMKHLEDLDEVAYVRFASVYRRFRDVNQFLSEVESLIGR